MKAANPQYIATAARGRTCAAHMQRRAPAAPRCTAPRGGPVRDGAILQMGAIRDASDCAQGEADIHHDTGEASVPRVLLIDKDPDSAEALSALLMPEAHVIHAATLAEAQHLLRRDIFALVVIDPALPDGNAATLIPLIVATPVLVHAQREPAWRESVAAFLPKPWTSQRRLWSTISRLLGVPTNMSAGD
jgi:two-component system, OmpR family, phosphate regulon response regulator OmpR